MKSFTDLEQSKVLEKILPIESADFAWNVFADDDWDLEREHGAKVVPCWSLDALLSVLPSDIIRNEKKMFLTLEKAGAYNLYYKSKDRLDELWETDFEPIDACYKMILTLHELKLL